MELQLRVAPEVRLRSTVSGLRADLVEPSAGDGSEHHGGVGAGSSGRIRRATRVGARPAGADGKEGRGTAAPLAELDRRARAAQESEDVSGLRSVEEALTSLHLENHHLRRRPDASAASALPAKERAMLQRKALRAAQPEIPVFRRAARAKARALAETEADHFVRTLDVAHAIIAQHRVAELDDQWNALAGHDRCVVIAELDAEFATDEGSCTCVDAGWDPDTSRGYVTVVARYPGPELIAERGPGASSSGRGMLRRRTPAERNALYLSAIASFALATVRRVISVAVAADDVRLLVVRTPAEGAGLEPVYVGTLTREDVTLRPSMADPVPLLLASATRPPQFQAPANELMALAPDPAVLDVVQRCVEALEDHELDGLLAAGGDQD